MKRKANDILIEFQHDEDSDEKRIVMAIRDRQFDPNYELRYVVHAMNKVEAKELRDVLTKYLTKWEES